MNAALALTKPSRCTPRGHTPHEPPKQSRQFHQENFMQRAFALELKSLNQEGEFTGIASTYGGEPDQQNDIVDVGAFTRTLQSSKERPLLYQHRDPIDKVTLADSATGLLVTGKLLLAVQAAKDAYALLQAGIVKGLSIGFETLQATHDEKGVRHLKEVKLWEVSLVTFAANQNAMVTAVKSTLDLDRLHSALVEFKTDVLAALDTKASSTKRVDGVDLPARCFAYVGAPKDISTWHLPILFPGDVPRTMSHIRDALSRFNHTDIAASERPAVLARIRRAAQQHGIE
jgi:hypothetical protein